MKLRSYMLRALIIALSLVILAGGGLIFARQRLILWSITPVQILEPIVFDFPAGTSLRTLGKRLEKHKLIDNNLLFRIWIKYHSEYHRFQAGKYRFAEQIAPHQIASMMLTGAVYSPIVLQFTIPEGFTLKQIASRLERLQVGSQAKIQTTASNSKFIKKLGLSSTSLEGYLYPATYAFAEFPSIEVVLTKMVQTFRENIPKDYEGKIAELGLSLNQAVIFASLIELETPHADERPLVSEVIWNRYKRGIALGIDASIIYGIKNYDGNLRFKHLRDKSNPYNTRVHRGLPPTPICSPSLSSLLAVINPAQQKNYYYVLDPDQGTRHHFSKSLKEHNRWVNKLKVFQKRQRIISRQKKNTK